MLCENIFWKTVLLLALWYNALVGKHDQRTLETETPEKGRFGWIRTEMRGLKGPLSDGQLPG